MPHTMGNEYNSICCGLSGIMFVIEMVEVKDVPKQRGKPKYSGSGKTGEVFLRLCKGIFNTAN